jgi:predicted site-specific integrase-resolvase
MKLSEYAKRNNICYRTAHRHWKLGLISGRQLETGTIVVAENSDKSKENTGVVLYARVSSSENKDNLNSQMERLKGYAAAKGYKVVKEIKEIGSGLNDNRKLLTSILEDDKWAIILVEHKDRLARFGTRYIEILLSKLSKKIEIINDSNNDTQDIVQDFVSIITSFCARLYGIRRSKRKTEQLILKLKNEK